MTMHSSEKLAQALRDAGLPALAERAAKHEFHDFLSEHDMPCMLLDSELTKASRTNLRAIDVRRRHHEGEFDASKAESDEWARSPEGQAAYQKLVNPGRKGGPT